MNKPSSIKRIPRPTSIPKSIQIVTDKGKKRIKVPEGLSFDQIQDFTVYSQVLWDFEHANKKFAASNGKVYPLPAMNKQIILKVLKTQEEKDAFLEKDKQVRSMTGKLLAYRKKVFGSQFQGDGKALFDEYSTEVLELLGRNWTASEVHSDLLKRGVDLPYKAILEFHQKNREKVTALRNKFNEDIGDVSLSNKRSRLERLNFLYHEIGEDFEKVSTPLLRTNLSKEMRGIIEQARKECEGEQLKLTVDGNIDVNSTIVAMMNTDNLMYGLTINQIVISRVAARLRMNSQWLIDRLAHSYYAKHNGYRANSDLSTKPIYPTSIQYDILSEEMEKKNKEWESKQMSYAIEDVEVESEETVDLKQEEREEIKRRLREKLHIK